MGNINQLIKERRLQLGLTLEQVAEKVGVGKSTVRKWETGLIQNMRRDNMQKLADALSLNPLDLLEFDIIDENLPLYESPRNKVEIVGQNLYLNIPLYESISCGKGLFVDDNIIEYITLPETLLNTNKEYFCQYATGDSMINENINEGDLLVFEKSQIINNGQIGCFCIDDNIATCKKFYKDDASAIITLQPANPKYPPIIVTIETMNFHVVGKLSLVINKRD